MLLGYLINLQWCFFNLKLVCHLYLEKTKTSEMIQNYLIYMNTLNFATIDIPIKRKSVFSGCGCLFMFWFSAYTTMVTWFLSHQNVNINKLPHSNVLYFCMKRPFVYDNFQGTLSHQCYRLIYEIFIFLTNKVTYSL